MGKTLGKTFLGLELGWEGIMVSDEKTRRVARMTGLETENARACPFLTTCERRVKPEKKKTVIRVTSCHPSRHPSRVASGAFGRAYLPQLLDGLQHPRDGPVAPAHQDAQVGHHPDVAS